MAEKNSKTSKAQSSKATSKDAKSPKAKPSDNAKALHESASSVKPDVKIPLDDYVVVRPPPTIDTHHGFGVLSAILSAAVIAIGGYTSWPMWSPYVAEQFPVLEYKPTVDPRVAGLVGRLDALEAQTSGGVVKSMAISDMKIERTRLQGEVGQLLKRLNSIEKTIGDVKKLVNATNGDVTMGETKLAIDQITQRLSELEKSGDNYGVLTNRLNQLETISVQGSGDDKKRVTNSTKKINSLIGKLESRVLTLEETGQVSEGANSDAAAIILAVSQLRKSNVTGEPFDKDTDVLIALAKAHPDMLAALSILKKTAKLGAATIITLRAEFSKIASDVVRLGNVGSGNNWLDGVKKRILALISIRKTGAELNDVSVDALVAQAEEHLRQGDLTAAVKIINQLKVVSKPAAKTAEPWLKRAKNRLMVERAVASLHVYAVSLVALKKK
jgi:hypothetical protein